MALPAWWQVAVPHKDIREKKFTEAVFAADLSDVLNGTAPKEYSDPRLFFERTYMTKGLVNLVQNVLSRLVTGGGDPVIQLQTPFGGGKTHSLLALYHVAKSVDQINHMEQVKNLLARFPRFKGVKVAAFVGTAADPVKGRTPWGEIAHQLGCYEIVEEHDKLRVSPGKERIHDMIRKSGPVLILIDELLEYVVKANKVEKSKSIKEGQTSAFLQEITEAVATSDRSALVLTLPASVLEQYDEEAEKTLAQLRHISGREESIYVPVEGMEIYEIIRKRLFESLGDPAAIRNIAGEYFSLYRSLAGEVPTEVQEISYRDKMEHAYPLHPELVDVLYERWGSFHTFQRTRGVLRLLARIVGDLYERKVPAPLIQSSQIDLSCLPVRHEFIKHIGNEYDSIVAADIENKARHIDKSMGSEYEKYGIAKGLATSVFLYSFSGGGRHGITLPWLRVALLREDIHPSIVGDAMNKLEDSLWYLHEEKHQYRFKNEPNLNRIIVEKEEAVDDNDVRSRLEDALRKLTEGSVFQVFRWPRSSDEVEDSPKLKLVVLEPRYEYGKDETERFSSEIVQKTGSAHRSYRNTTFILALDSSAYLGLVRHIRRCLALEGISKDPGITLSDAAKQELKKKLEGAKEDLPFQVMLAYRHVGWLQNKDLQWRDMGLPTVGEKATLAQRVEQFLKHAGRILSSMGPKLIFDKAFDVEETEKTLEEIYNVFLRTPGLPCLESKKVLIDAAILGAKNRLLGLRVGRTLYYGEAPHDVPMDSLIVRPEYAGKEKEKPVPQEPEIKPGPEEPDWRGTGGTSGKESVPPTDEGGRESGPEPSGVRSVNIKAAVPWDKVGQLVTGVIRPLKMAGADLTVYVEIQARSMVSIDRMTLDNKVKETLVQLGSSILEWQES